MATFGETKIDPKIIEELIRFSKNIQKAPKLVPAQDEIQLETTPYDVVYEEDKVRLLHYKPMTEKTNSYTLYYCLCSYQQISYFRYSSKKKLGKESTRTRNRCVHD